ncbi:hypothetical protein PR048_020992 [Dryococelus australis]|uniref:PiggyBac transposable element-derived protein domain-containing protein n=1 Tax=Dryococelus australis TaxID=614101 RepID=A0ABQ9GX01_9NEOP|nr:hypothetical protein PR048_020992 [Dryococelus australis]
MGNNGRGKGEDGTKWEIVSTTTTHPGRLQKQNILRQTPGSTLYAKISVTATRVASSWRLLINEPMLKHTKLCTESEARKQLEDNTWHISLMEIDSFIALLYAHGFNCAKGLEVDSLWSTKWGPQFFRDPMSRDRFREIMKFIRFDLKDQRSARLVKYKFALVSEVWDSFIENCLLCFVPGANITVVEQLFPTKARCKFTQYMANKPDKFGIKFWLAADVDTKYLLNGFPFLGKDVNRPPNQSLPEHVMKRMAPYFGKAKKLKMQSTSLEGTVNRAQLEIPQSEKTRKAPLYDTVVMKNYETTLTVYQGKKNKNVLVLSTLHPNISIGNDQKHLPETVTFYNATKYIVDVFDQMARKYSVNAASRRWPVQFFFTTYSTLLE